MAYSLRHHLRRHLSKGVFLCVLIHIGTAAAESPLPTVHIRGSTNLMPMLQRVAENYMREHAEARIVVSAGGTARGYKSLIDGTADIAMASSAPTEQTLAFLNQGSPKFVSTTVGYVAMVPVVNPGNTLHDLKMEELRDIFTGRVDNFKQIGGRDLPIKVLIGPPSDGLTESWRTTLIGDDDSHTPKVTILDERKRIKLVAADFGAVSFISNGDLDGRVKALTVDGENADEENVRAKRYVLVAPLMLVTNEHPAAAARAFVGYFSSVSGRLQSPGFIAVQADTPPNGAAP